MHRPLGPTNLLASPLAFGAFKIGRNEKIKYAQAYPLPTDTEVEQLLNGVLDLGINVIDTAPAYGISEERIGRHISHRREQFILSTKVGETFENGASTFDFAKAAIVHSIQRSLQRLRAEVLDFVFLHSDGHDLAILSQTDAVATLQSLRDQGLIRFLGMSGKTVEGARASLRWADALMVEYHPHDVSHAQVIAEAAKQNVVIFVKKPLASGQISPAEALPFVLQNPAVSTVVIGGLNLDHIRENLRIAQRVLSTGEVSP